MTTFRESGAEDVFHGRDTRAARRACPPELWERLRRRLDQIDSITTLSDLAVPPGNRLEPLKGVRKGQTSIRINNRYRIGFVWTDQGAENVEIVDYR